jgi:hypothetical protein
MRDGPLVDWDPLGPMQVPARLPRPSKLEVFRRASPPRIVCSSFCNNKNYVAQKSDNNIKIIRSSYVCREKDLLDSNQFVSNVISQLNINFSFRDTKHKCTITFHSLA